jgi:hypothetical protein
MKLLSSFHSLMLAFSQGIGGKAAIGGKAGLGGGATASSPGSFAPCVNGDLGNGIRCVTSGANFTGGADCDVTLSVSSGQFIVGFTSDNTKAGTLTASDTLGNSFANTQGPTTDSGSTVRSNVWTVASSGTNASDIIDFHTTNNAQFFACTVVVFSGLNVSPIDQTPALTSYSATTTPSVGPTGTTTQATELLVGMFGALTTGTFEGFDTGGSGWVKLDTSAGIGSSTGSSKPLTGIVAKTVTSTGTYSPLGLFSNADSGGGFALSLKK